MAKNQTIQHKRSAATGNKPSTAQIEIGELAINFADKSIYTRTPGGAIIELARDLIKSGTQPASPTDGDLWYDTPNDIMNVWDGTKWVHAAHSGKDVLPANTTSSPTWSSGAGTLASPYVFTITAAGGSTVQVTSVTITGLAPDQYVPVIDLNAATNGGRFTVTNDFADSSGVLRFNIIFTDLPSSANGTTMTANFKVGTATVYINVIASIGSPFPQTVSFPTNTQSVTTSWTAANDTLTSTGDLLISLDGVTYGTGPLAITTGATLYTKWTGGPGTGLGIDGAEGTTITGAVVASGGGSTSSSLVIDKTPSTITFTAATGAALSTAVDSNTVTLSGVNSYVYLTSANTMMASVAGGTFGTVPASGTSLYAINGQTLQVRQTSSATSSTTTTVTITAGGTTAGFSVTTSASGTIDTPSITSPISGSTGIIGTSTIISSAYSTTGVAGTHLNSDWEVATDSGFATVVASSPTDATNLTSWSPSGLLATTQYWVRVRYRSNTSQVSDWSPLHTFTTTADKFYLITSSSAVGSSITIPTGVKAGDFIVIESTAARSGAAAVSSATPVGWTDVIPNSNVVSGSTVFSTKKISKIADGTESGIVISTYTLASLTSARVYVFRRGIGVVSTVSYFTPQSVLSTTVPALSSISVTTRTRPTVYFLFMATNSSVTQDIQYTITQPTDFVDVFSPAGTDYKVAAWKSFIVGDTLQDNSFKCNTTTGAIVYGQESFVIEYT